MINWKAVAKVFFVRLNRRHSSWVSAWDEGREVGYREGVEEGSPTERMKHALALGREFRKGLVVGAAIIAWAEAIRRRHAQCPDCGTWISIMQSGCDVCALIGNEQGL